MTKPITRDPIYRRRRFEAEIIELCVRWYITYRLSYRDLVDMMADRGIAAAQAFFRKALATSLPRWPRKITMDGHVPSYQSLRLLRREDPKWKYVLVRKCPYLNNIVERQWRNQSLKQLWDRALVSLDICLALSKASGDERTGHCKGLGPQGRARACETAVCRGAQAHRFNRSTSASQFAPGGAADCRQLALRGCRHRASRRGAGGSADADFQGPDPGHLSRRVMMWTAAGPTWKRLDGSPGR